MLIELLQSASPEGFLSCALGALLEKFEKSLHYCNLLCY